VGLGWDLLRGFTVGPHAGRPLAEGGRRPAMARPSHALAALGSVGSAGQVNPRRRIAAAQLISWPERALAHRCSARHGPGRARPSQEGSCGSGRRRGCSGARRRTNRQAGEVRRLAADHLERLTAHAATHGRGEERIGVAPVITSRAEPVSTRRPPYITAMRSEISVATPTSCVTNTTAIPSACCNWRSSSRTKCREPWSARRPAVRSAGRREPWRSSRTHTAVPAAPAD
jgi:hypothetical protein